MKKMIALYKAPGDADAFMDHYKTTHMLLVEKIPGLVKTELTRIDRTFMGDQGNFLIAEMYFEDEESFKAALKSPENAATGADLTNFAEGIVTVMIGETL